MVKFFDVKTSIYLDIVRFLCAFVVMVTHCCQVIFEMNFNSHFIGDIQHGAVMIFFVLSGYVIAYTTTVKKRTIVEYTIARLSRLYSIFFPAIILTVICALLTKAVNPSFYEIYNNGNEILRYILGVFYLNEIWFLSAAPRMNGVIWSLGYEFWFYAVFGIFFFKKKGLKGFFLPFLICLLVGPKILLMMVIWMFGFLAFRIQKIIISTKLSWFFVFVFLVISILCMSFFSSIPFKLGTYPLFWASQFITDYVVGVFFGISIWFLPLKTKKVQSSQIILKNQKIFRTIGDLTFPIYVLHWPLLILFKSLMPIGLGLNIQFLIISLSTFLICIFVGMYLESKKQLWSLLFNRILLKLVGKKDFET
ncbi:acyltransferase [Flavobacterium ovatum]|uniref:acyltransferase family protein n=1 Tax=Flavobacterium ovatum TaxID=1928857 RepID=UPI00344E663D